MKFLSTLLLAIGAASVAADCTNPVFSASAQWGQSSVSINVEGTQAVVPEDSQVCVAYRGQNSCCSASTLTSIEESIVSATAVISAAREKVEKYDPNENFPIEQIKGLCDLLSGEKEDECDAVLTEKVTKVNNIAKELATAGLNCVDIMLGYRAGMLCFACAADWEDKVDAANNKITIAQNSCDRVSATCSPMMEKSHDLIIAIVELFDAIFEQFDLGVLASITKGLVENIKDYCEGTKDTKGDCKKIVCSQWLNGLHGNVNAISTSRRMLKESIEYENIHPEIIDVMDSVLEAYHGIMEPVHQADAATSAHGRMLADNVNTYSDSGGVDPVEDGCKEPGVTCPSDNFLFIVGGVAAVVVVVGAVGFFVFKKKSLARGNKV